MWPDQISFQTSSAHWHRLLLVTTKVQAKAALLCVSSPPALPDQRGTDRFYSKLLFDVIVCPIIMGNKLNNVWFLSSHMKGWAMWKKIRWYLWSRLKTVALHRTAREVKRQPLSRSSYQRNTGWSYCCVSAAMTCVSKSIRSNKAQSDVLIKAMLVPLGKKNPKLNSVDGSQMNKNTT